MLSISLPRPPDHLISFFVIIIVAKLVQFALGQVRGSRLPRLKGPSNNNILFGRLAEVFASKDCAALYQGWAEEYGPVFQIPAQFLSGRHIILCDPKAISHLHSKDTFTYHSLPASKRFFKKFFGPNMLTVEREDHRRQRRALSPAFSIAAIRTVTSVFYECAYKLKANWDTLFESSDEVIIDVQKWLSRTTLDSIGIAGFGHDFKALEGHESTVAKVFNGFSDDIGNGVLASIFPFLDNLPTKRSRMMGQMKKATTAIAYELLENCEKMKAGSQNVQDRSILGLLFRGQADDATFKLMHEEVVSEINLLLAAGYETTSIILSWALIELARHPESQRKLREELREFATSDPTWDQLTSGLPYLDAVVHETLRLHPPLEEILRVAMEDDIMPLSDPIETASGQILSSLVIPKGTILHSPIIFTNRNEKFWGPNAKSFVPERWLEEDPQVPKDIHGHRHLLTFSDGPKICLGRGFALAELKAVLSVLIRNYSFELVNGPETELDEHISLLTRPKVAGEPGAALPMRVRQVVG